MPTYRNISGKQLVIHSHHVILQPDELYETPYPIHHSYIDNGLIEIVDFLTPVPVLPMSEEHTVNVGTQIVIDIKDYTYIIAYITAGTQNLELHFQEVSPNHYTLTPNDVFQYKNHYFHRLIVVNPATNTENITILISKDY